MKEIWERWMPTNDLSPKYYVDSLTDSIDGLKIYLSDSRDEKKKAEVIFDCSVHAYRSTDEGFMLKTINNLDKQHGTHFYSGWTFFKVKNSDYMQWLVNSSFEIALSEELIHFSFLAVDSVVDVIAAYEPKIKIGPK
ncbi:hypothetical protein [Salinithrix halophila]|uniref:Uncharacterized protein n=1 Tax=Salinithrix halophila TaxID=1485204 RepID=A0ABV8J9D3_9BACL